MLVSPYKMGNPWKGVNEVNSHPHQGEGFSVVHNGIIENAGI